MCGPVSPSCRCDGALMQRWRISFRTLLLQPWVRRALVFAASWLLRGLFATLRPVFLQDAMLRQLLADKKQPLLFAVWHGRMLYLLQVYRRYRPERITVLVSQSKDGELISLLLEHFGVDATRGSSSRGGALGVLELMHKATEGYQVVAITPDGPRGPRYVVQPGIIAVASRSGALIIPITYNAQWKKVCASWDQFLIPLPFSRIVVMCGAPIAVPPQADATTLHEKQHELEKSLQHITALADGYF
jgi:lysophospholipid acyltransferase (LPLAT)-like uncharacterized protein